MANKSYKMNETDEIPFHKRYKLFVGFDWASDHHDIVTVDEIGKVVMELTIEDTAEGWILLRKKFVDKIGQEDLCLVAVAVETCNGPSVERLLDMGCHVYPVNPKAAKEYRGRKSPMGSKCDRLDAWSLGDALRTDGHAWKILKSDDPLTQELRILCRDEVKLIEQRTALVLQLRAALNEYYPAALEAFDDWSGPGAWAFIETFPTPQDLARAGKRKWKTFLKDHRLSCREKNQTRLDAFSRAHKFCGPPAVTKAKSRLAVTIVKQLGILHTQLAEYRKAIEALFEEHPDSDIFKSLPMAGAKLAPRLLSEFGQNRDRFDDPEILKCYAGTAPVTKQSGKSRFVIFRRGCNKNLRTAVHQWVDLSRKECAWAQAYYKAKRQQGKSHCCALRCLGQRWLNILWKMWQNKTTYDEALHTRNQVRHGSWIVKPG